MPDTDPYAELRELRRRLRRAHLALFFNRAALFAAGWSIGMIAFFTVRTVLDVTGVL